MPASREAYAKWHGQAVKGRPIPEVNREDYAGKFNGGYGDSYGGSYPTAGGGWRTGTREQHARDHHDNQVRAQKKAQEEARRAEEAATAQQTQPVPKGPASPRTKAGMPEPYSNEWFQQQQEQARAAKASEATRTHGLDSEPRTTAGLGKPPQYDTTELRARYLKWGKHAAKALKEGGHGGDDLDLDWLRNTIKLDAHSGRSSVIDAKLAELEKATDRAAQGQLVREIKIDTDAIERHTHNLLQSKMDHDSSGPSMMDSLVEGTDLSVKQLKGYAEQAHKIYDDFAVQHQQLAINLEAARDAVKHAYGDYKKLKAAYDFGKHYYTFAQTLASKQAAAAASGTVLGPVGPAVAYLAIMAELCGLLAEMVEVTGGLVNVMSDVTSGKNAMPEGFDSVGTVKKVFENVKSVLDGIQTHAKPLIDIGNKVNQLLGRKK